MKELYTIDLDPATVLDMRTIIYVKWAKGISRTEYTTNIARMAPQVNFEVSILEQSLYKVNEQLFNLEDLVRTEEGCTLDNYKEITRLNDQRAELKRNINALYGAVGETKIHNGEVKV